MYNDNFTAVASRAVIDDTSRVSDSIETLARRYHAELLHMLRARLPSEQDAADLAQEAYTRLLRYEGKYSGEELRRMLFRIAHNLLTDHWRWRRLRSVATHMPIDELEPLDPARIPMHASLKSPLGVNSELCV
jgi:DNA-directed RNA polymerase specialized sigma24 family protein